MFLDFFVFIFWLQGLFFEHEKHKINENSVYFMFRKILCDFASLRSNRKIYFSTISPEP